MNCYEHTNHTPHSEQAKHISVQNTPMQPTSSTQPSISIHPINPPSSPFALSPTESRVLYPSQKPLQEVITTLDHWQTSQDIRSGVESLLLPELYEAFDRMTTIEKENVLSQLNPFDFRLEDLLDRITIKELVQLWQLSTHKNLKSQILNSFRSDLSTDKKLELWNEMLTNDDLKDTLKSIVEYLVSIITRFPLSEPLISSLMMEMSKNESFKKQLEHSDLSEEKLVKEISATLEKKNLIESRLKKE